MFGRTPANPPWLPSFDQNGDRAMNAIDLGLVASQFGPCPGGAWQSLAPMPGGARQEVAVVALNGDVYVLGGFNGAGQIVATVERYNPLLDAWSTRAPLPVAMHHANAAAVNGKLYIAGFLTGSGFAADARVFEYDPMANAWTQKTSMPAGTARGASGVGVIGGEIFVAGGYRGGTAVDDFSSYDVATDTWTVRPDLPRARDHMAAGAINDVLYVAGGRDGTIAGHFPDVDAYDPMTDTWAPQLSMPTSRGGSAGAVVGGRLYVFGGEGSGSGSGVFGQAEAYAPTSGHWAALQMMLTARHGTGAAVIGGVVYIPGGATVQSFGAVAGNESFAPPP
jgi:N-acetylneuraminic acid mutarotase